MKRIRVVVFVLLFFSIFSSCTQDNEAAQIKSVADKFLIAVFDMDYEEAKKYSSPEMVEKFDELEKLPMMISLDCSDEEIEAVETKSVFKIDDIIIEGDKATATTKLPFSLLFEKEFILRFAKVGKTWVLDEPNLGTFSVLKEVEEGKIVIFPNGEFEIRNAKEAYYWEDGEQKNVKDLLKEVDTTSF